MRCCSILAPSITFAREPRFDVVYHLLKLKPAPASVAAVGKPMRVRLLCGISEGEHVPSVMDLWKSADWAEREVYDLFGIVFDGHADLRRIQMPNDWEGHPLRKDYPMRGPARERAPRPTFANKSNVVAGTPPSGRTLEALARASEAGPPAVTFSPTPLEADVVSRSDNAMVLSMGPQHPSTHGVLQIVLEIEGENVVKAEPEIGYLHTGIEKTAEGLFWTQAQTVIERMDYLAPSSNALCYALAVEKLLGITDRIPERAQVIRVLAMELTRIASHCVWLGTHGIDLGAISVFFYCFDLRENILDLQEAAGGARMHPNYMRVGGLNGDPPEGFLAKLDALIEKFPGRMRELRGLLQANPIFQDRTIDVGILSPEEALQWSVTGPSLRASGIAYDVRKAFPYIELRDVRLRRSDAHRRRRIRALSRAARRDGAVHAHRRAGASPARHARTGDDRRSEGCASAERDDRALDGGADPSLQNHQRRLSRAAR